MREYKFHVLFVYKSKKKEADLFLAEDRISINNEEQNTWRNVFYVDVSCNYTDIRIKKFIFSRKEKGIEFNYKTQEKNDFIRVLCINEDYCSIINAFDEIKNIQEQRKKRQLLDYNNWYKCFCNIEKLEASARRCIDDYNSYQSTIRDHINRVKDEQVIQVLSEMPIDEINRQKLGFRISAFKKAGINTVFDLLRYKENRYGISGVGDDNYIKSIRIAEQIKQDVNNKIDIDIQSGKKSVHAFLLIANVYVLLKGQFLIKEISNFLSEKNMSTFSSGLRECDSFDDWYWKTDYQKGILINKTKKGTEFLESKEVIEIKSNIDKFKGITQNAKNESWKDFLNNTAPYYAFLEKYSGKTRITHSKEISEELVEKIENLDVDLAQLKSSLRRYQLFGVKYIIMQKNVLLGDEMGLGKTVQAIAAMANLCKSGEDIFLVICPAGVLINWCREIERHSYLKTLAIYGKNYSDNYALWKKGGYVGVVSYEGLSKFCDDDDFPISMVVVDEAHYIKNETRKRTKNVLKQLKRTKYRLLMTGTPLENNVEEMCSLISYLQPYVVNNLKNSTNYMTVERFKREISVVYLRRTRKEVLAELPELIEYEEWGSLNSNEKIAYRRDVMNGDYMAMRRISFNIDDLKESTKANRIVEICDAAKEDDRKIIIFSFFRRTLEKLNYFLGDIVIGSIVGGISTVKKQEVLDQFEKAQGGAVLLAQIEAGGIGLNIQCASVIILCEPQFKPSSEKQAISRAYRMGQAKSVEVHRMLIEDSIDERLLDIIRRKQEIFDAYADISLVAQSELNISEKEIAGIVEEEKKRLCG